MFIASHDKDSAALADMPLVRRLARRAMPGPIRRRLGALLSRWWTERSPACAYQRQVILPRIADRGGTVLLVGCRSYTAQEPRFLEQRGVRCRTLDIDPVAAKWRARGRHVVAPFQQAPQQFEPAQFDAVLFSGMFGFGVDTIEAQNASLEACAAILKPDALLVLGWNTDRVAEPATLVNLRAFFRASNEAGFAGRKTFARSTHIFDFYCRRVACVLPFQDRLDRYHPKI